MHGEPSVRACRRACAAMCRSARRVPAAQQRRPSDHSVLLRPHRWWRLLTPYRFKECPDHIIVKGAERTQPSRMGTFGKMAVSVDARPVYKNDFDQFLVCKPVPRPSATHHPAHALPPLLIVRSTTYSNDSATASETHPQAATHALRFFLNACLHRSRLPSRAPAPIPLPLPSQPSGTPATRATGSSAPTTRAKSVRCSPPVALRQPLAQTRLRAGLPSETTQEAAGRKREAGGTTTT